jgi:hypothetical protein
MNDLDQMLREYALRAIADDYENLEKILQDVTGWAAERGITADRPRTVMALEALIRDGYAQAYCLTAGPPGKAEPVAYSAYSVNDLWFYVSPKGKQLAQTFQEEWT